MQTETMEMIFAAYNSEVQMFSLTMIQSRLDDNGYSTNMQ
jgi:hypothetical protein